MNFAFSEEQEELRRIVRQFLESKSSEAEVRRLMETTEGYDPAVWSQMAKELGLQSLVIPEEFGGQGFSYVELVVVLEEMGRRLLCAPYFSTVALATNLLLHAGDDAAKKELLPGIAAGDSIATVAFTEESGRWDEAGITMEATTASSGSGAAGFKLNGTKMFVLDGHTANVILVAARTGAGVSIFQVAGDAAGLTRTPLATMDQTRKQAKLEFNDVDAKLIGTEGAGWAAIERMLDLAAVALAAEQVGGGQFVLEMAVQYAKDRVQFGNPIGKYQGVKHPLAEMYVDIESTKSLLYYAAWALDESPAEVPRSASLAKAYASDAFARIGIAGVQLHGAVGYTAEYDIQLYLKRSKWARPAFGDADFHYERVATLGGL
jgi:alkylation response protein AidB-like acyl-CoA dehydrogenase